MATTYDDFGNVIEVTTAEEMLAQQDAEFAAMGGADDDQPTDAGEYTPPTQEELEAGYHRDLGEIEYDPEAESFYSKFVSLIYYVNDSDGDTIFFDEKGNKEYLTPKEGQLVWFPTYTLHGGTPPQKSKKRIIINFILEKE